MTLAKNLHGILVDLGYDRCGGYAYKKTEGKLVFYLDNPFTGWDNEEETESFILDFNANVQRSEEIGYSLPGKMTIEVSVIFRSEDSVDVIKNAESDLRLALNRLLGN